MLWVWRVEEVKKEVSVVPGVESIIVNFVAGNTTVRYDKTRLEATDTKCAVRQKSYELAAQKSDQKLNLKEIKQKAKQRHP